MRRYHAYLILPMREKWLETLYAPDLATALELACVPSEGMQERLTRDTAVTCCGDTVRVERA